MYQPAKLAEQWGDESKQMGTICLGRTTGTGYRTL